MKPYEKGSLSYSTYSHNRHKLEEFFQSERYFLTKEIIKPGTTILDIGGASGGLGNAIQTSVQKDIKYFCIDPDVQSIRFGKELYPHFEFSSGYFPKDAPEKEYDLVVMMALFPQIEDWKTCLLNMRNRSKRFINLSIVARLDGTTVIDKDVSYAYYFDSGERVHQIVHNLYELLNFCSTAEMNLRKITFYGYHLKEKGKNYRCVPYTQQIVGNLLLEVNDKPACRTGAISKKEFIDNMEAPKLLDNSPEVEIIIDGKVE